MKNKIYDLSIKSLRGIKNLELKQLGDVNVILGDNNSGKTTILEAVELFRKKGIYNVIRVLNNRSVNRTTNIDDFLYIFNVDDKLVDVSMNSSSGKSNVTMDYSLNKINFSSEIFLSDKNDDKLKKVYSFIIEQQKLEGKELGQIKGKYQYNEYIENYSFIPLDFSYNMVTDKDDAESNRIIYESPFEHFNLNASMISNIKKNEAYYRIFIQVLRIFDSSINKVDILTTNNYFNGSQEPVIYIQCDNKDPMPIATYGDGIKKVICIASMITYSIGGVLLIDEIETSLHHNYYSDVLYFLIKVAKKFDIQLFITTHSKEIVEVFSKYNIENKLESNIKFYTLKKKQNKTNSRMLNDSEVVQYNNLGVEVRD